MKPTRSDVACKSPFRRQEKATIKIMKTDMDTAWRTILAAAGRGDPAPGAPDIDVVLNDRSDIEPAAAEMIECLLPLATAREGFVIGQIGQSLDGRICTESGDSHYVNGDAALTHLHRLRALVDCVLVGVGTVVADHPQLTVRRVSGPHPVRVVLDPRGRAPADVSPLASEADPPPTLHLVGASCMERLPAPAAHVRRLPLPEVESGVAPRDVIAALASVGCRRVLVEGGANTLSRFVADGMLDRLHVLVAPLLIGSGRPGLSLPPIQRLCDAARPKMRRYTLDGDTLFDVVLTRRS